MGGVQGNREIGGDGGVQEDELCLRRRWRQHGEACGRCHGIRPDQAPNRVPHLALPPSLPLSHPKWDEVPSLTFITAMLHLWLEWFTCTLNTQAGAAQSRSEFGWNRRSV